MATSTEADWENPCERADVLKAAFYRLLAGQQEMEVEYLANGVTRRIKYSQSDINALQAEIRALDHPRGFQRSASPPAKGFEP